MMESWRGSASTMVTYRISIVICQVPLYSSQLHIFEVSGGGVSSVPSFFLVFAYERSKAWMGFA